MAKPKLVPIADIERDMLLQPRAELHRDWIEDYAADMVAGAKFPPIVVFFDGEKYWLGDGFHRIYAAEAAGLDKVLADVREGKRRDALLHSVSANAEHGHRRTNEDKRRAVDIMLTDPQWARWSDAKIAEQIGVHQTTVSNRRRDLLSQENLKIGARLVTRGGTTYEMNTGNIGASSSSVEAQVEAEAKAVTTANYPIEPFDWESSKLRNTAMEAIRALAELPSAPEVIAAWMKSDSYGEPTETLERALSWLTAFHELYREAEPRRWARVQASRGGMLDAAE
jgi:DNA-binding Lrp family transcriptional regulator